MNEPNSIRHQIDLICDRYEQQFHAGRSPRIEDALAELSDLEARPVLFRELLQLDIDFARQAQQTLDTKSLRQRFPQYAEIIDALLHADDVTLASEPNHREPKPSESKLSQSVPVDLDATIDTVVDGEQRAGLAAEAIAVGASVRYVGDYEILNEIARGGMGVVYRGRQTSLGRLVALKMILAGELAGKDAVARFRSEAEAAANLNHPGIVPIYEIGEFENQHYFSMGLIEGPSLSERLREHPLDSRQAAVLLQKVADAVDYAHQQGVIHRDLKPGNILLDAEGNPHITDFGLAKRLAGSEELTTTGQVLGTPAYMPPEQARGDLDNIGPESDVYSLGAILYAALCGRPPHTAGSAIETLKQVVESEPISARSLNPSVPKDLETICAKCLAKTPAERYGSAGELSEELGRFLRGEPIHARPISRTQRLYRWAIRHPAVASLLSLVTLLTATLAIGGPIVAVTQSRLKQTAQDNQRRASALALQEREARQWADQSRQALALEKDRSDRALYARTIELAHQQIATGNRTAADDLLASTPNPLRGFEYDYVNGLCNAELAQLDGMNGTAQRIAFAPDGVHVIASQAGSNPKLYVWDIASNQPQDIRSVPGLAVSRDGSKVVAVSPNDPASIQITDSLTGEVFKEFAASSSLSSFADLGGPGDNLFVCLTTDRHIRVWDITTGTQLHAIEDKWRRNLFPIAISPDGTKLAYRRVDDGTVELKELKNNRRLYGGPIESKLAGVHRFPVEFHPDGKSFAVGGDGVVELRDSNNGDLLGQLEGLQGYSYDLAYSPAGDRIAVTCQDESIRIYSTTTTRLVNRLTGHKIGNFYGVTAVAFDQTGNRIISSGADTTVRVWDAWSGDMAALTVDGRLKDNDLVPNQAADYLVAQQRGINALHLSDDGSKLLVASKGRAIAVYDSTSGNLLRMMEGLSEQPACVDYEPTTARIAIGGGGLVDKQPSQVELWDFRTGEPIWQSDEARGPISRVAFIDAGKRIAVGVGSAAVAMGELFVLDAKTGEPIWKSEQVTNAVRDLAVSPDGAVIATVGRRPGIEISDAKTGKFLRAISDRVCSCVDFSRDGKQIAVGTPDWSVRVYDVDSGKLRWASRLHSGEVLKVQFSAEDRRLVSVSIDGTARVWDNEYGDLTLTLRNDGKPNLALAVSADGRLIAAAGDSRAISLYRTAHEQSNLESVTKAWIPLLEDSFEDTAWSEHWTPIDGQWKVVDGKLQATLGESKFFAGLKSATLHLDPLLPSMHEIAYDVQIEQPMAVVGNLRDAISQNAISSWFLGRTNTPMGFNRNEKGVSIAQMAAGTFKEVASRRDGTFAFEPGRTYRLKVRRLGDLIQTFVDDQPYRSARVPMKTPIPVFNLLATFGNAGDQVTFDNLRITMPPEGRLETVALEWVTELFTQQSLKPLVIQHIESADEETLRSRCGDQFEPQALRLAALEVASSWWQESTAIVTQAMELAADNALEPQQFLGIHQWINDNVPIKTEAVYRTLAALAFRAGDGGQAWNHWGQSSRLNDAAHFVPHPIDLAITALLQHRSGNVEDQQQRAGRLQQVMQASHWRGEKLANKWAAEVAETIPLPAPPEHHDRWTQAIWDTTHDLWIQGDAESTAKLLDPKFVYDSKRKPQQDAEVHSIEREPWLACIRLWHRGFNHHAKLTRASVDVREMEKYAVVVSSFVFELNELTLAWQQSDTFTRSDAEDFDDWKLARRVFRPTGIRLNNQNFHVHQDGWQAFDQLADQQTDVQQKVALLYLAGRYDAAYRAAIAMAKGSEQATDFAVLALAAFGAGEPQILQKAIQRAIELDPMVARFPVLRVHATETLAVEKPISIGRGVTCRPPSFFQPLPKRILGENQGALAVWQAADESLVAIFIDDEDNDIEKQADKFQASREQAYAAKFLLRQPTSVAEQPAIELLSGGLGIGWAIAGGGKPTLQRFVLVQREDHVLVCLVSAYADAFAFRDHEFTTFLNTIRFQDPPGEPDE